MVRSFSSKNSSLNNSNQSQVQSIAYIGPKALFDPNFIPPHFLIPEKKIQSIQTMLADAIEDHYPLNINVFGIKGSGKNLFLNYSLKNFYLNVQNRVEIESNSSNNLNSTHMSTELMTSWGIDFLSEKKGKIDAKFDPNLHNADVLSTLAIVFLRVDCYQKDCNQILFNLLIQLGQVIKKRLQIHDIAQLTDAKLWNLLKLLIQKINRPVVVYLQKPDELLHSLLLAKLYNFSKSQRSFQILTTMDCGLSKGVLKPIDGMDHKIFLDRYTGSELHQITQERSEMAFKYRFAPEALQIIVDYIIDFDTKVPGCCINYLKNVYPIIDQHGELHAEQIRDLSQYHFENFSFDAISMADFVTNTTFEDRLFLDYLIHSFQKSDKYYLSYSDMFKSYKMACEELGYSPNRAEFYRSLVKITEANILRPTVCVRSPEIKPINGVWPVAHYLTMPLDEMIEIMKVSFGDLGFNETNPAKFDDGFDPALF
jgi:Cdc6-like AAA superfamily ATPase